MDFLGILIFLFKEIEYHKGICPIAEKLHEESFLGYEMCLHELSDNDVDLILEAFHKVWKKSKQIIKMKRINFEDIKIYSDLSKKY